MQLFAGEESSQDVWEWEGEVRGHRSPVWCREDSRGRDSGLHREEEVSRPLHFR